MWRDNPKAGVGPWAHPLRKGKLQTKSPAIKKDAKKNNKKTGGGEKRGGSGCGDFKGGRKVYGKVSQSLIDLTAFRWTNQEGPTPKACGRNEWQCLGGIWKKGGKEGQRGIKGKRAIQIITRKGVIASAYIGDKNCSLLWWGVQSWQGPKSRLILMWAKSRVGWGGRKGQTGGFTPNIGHDLGRVGGMEVSEKKFGGGGGGVEGTRKVLPERGGGVGKKSGCFEGRNCWEGASYVY